MTDCPNCGFDVPEGVRICPNCGFDTQESQAGRVRELREEGKIHPGRLGAEDPNDFAGREPNERAPEHDPLPAEEAGIDNPEQEDAGL
jgi:RNA polymerase subunit RPABC4/transcription elongation factor Spt4